MQYTVLDDAAVFKLRADESANLEHQQNILVGTSTVAHMTQAACHREINEQAIYYMYRAGSTIEDMYKAMKKGLDTKSFFLDDDHFSSEIRDIS